MFKMSKILKKKIDSKSVWDIENSFYHLSNTSRIGKLIYHYEIYNMIKDIPGEILEFGVFKGCSLIRFLTFRNLIENTFSRKIYGFDTFNKFPNQKNNLDNLFKKNFTKDAGKPLSLNNLQKILNKKDFKNYELIQGNILKSLNKFLKKNPNLKISLLHLDMDVFEPTNFVLKKLARKIVRNGVILIDDYGTVEGATRAVDNFLKQNKSYKIKKLPFYKVPSYIIKN